MGMNTIGNIQEIDLDGFQVVKGDMFLCNASRHAMMMSIWPDSISFSKTSIQALNNCERVRLEVNSESKTILVIPVTAQDKDNVRWISSKSQKSRRIGCERFTYMLYRTWGWDTELAYRSEGKLVSANNKVMLLFPFDQAENWKHARNEGNG